MRTRRLTIKLGACALAISALALTAPTAAAAEFWLRAAATTVSMPDPSGIGTKVVPMWGYAACGAGFAACGAVSVPGPALNVPAGDTTLTVHLRNDLLVPTSLVINGLRKAMTPVWTDGTSTPRGTDLTKRVRSFDVEATPAASAGSAGGTQDYTWGSLANPVPPGTYLYQSGTHAQVQVQMGLYGALTKNAVDAVAGATRAQAYAGTAYGYDNQATLLYSEIDPALHDAVAGPTPTYGTPAGPTSTLNYAAKYFLINGQPYPFGSPVIQPVGDPGTTLLRMLNAGLTTHVPMIIGKTWNVAAEDGRPYSYASAGTATPMARNQYTALLPAAKTLDVLLPQQAGGPGVVPIVDRRLGLSNAGQPNGGMLAYLSVGPALALAAAGSASSNQPPVASGDGYDSVQGVVLNVSAAAGVLANDSDPDPGQSIMAVAVSNGTTARGGSYTLNANGSFSYRPAAGFVGTDTFTYQAADPYGALSAPATVTINLTTPAAPASTVLDAFTSANGLLSASWSQANNTSGSPDVQVVGGQAQALSVDLGGLALWNGAFGSRQVASFQSTALDNLALVLKASGGSATAPANLIRVRREAANGGEVVVSTLIGSIGAPVYVRQAAFAAAGSGTLTASADDKGLVLVWLGSSYLGGVQLPDVSVWKGSGRIGVQLQTVGGAIDNFAGGNF